MVFPTPTKVSGKPQILTLHDLLSLKLSSYMGSGVDRIQDYADAAKLIQVNHLPRSYAVDAKVLELHHKLWDEIHTKKS